MYVAKKVFNGTASLDETLADITAFLSGVWREGLRVEVRLYDSGKLKKRSANEALREAVKEHPCDFEHGAYNFLFSPEVCRHRFFWRGRAVHITASEGVYLFSTLVLGEPSDRYMLHNIRKRLGREFLADMPSVKNLPPCFNVDCALPDKHEKNAGKSFTRLSDERRRVGIL
jgi:hypothetical protein